MADLTISQLNIASTISGSEFIPITQADTTQSNKLTTVYTSPAAIGNYLKTTLIPTGVVWQFAGDLNPVKNLVPTGWFLCDGSYKLVKEYKALYEVIGNSFGVSSTPGVLFKLPDLRGRFILGYSSTEKNQSPTFGNFKGDPITFGQYGGQFRHQLTVDQIPAHKHTVTVYSSKERFLAYPRIAGSDQDIEQEQEGGPNGPYSLSYRPLFPITIKSTGGNNFHNSTPPYIAINYIIKY